MNKNYDNEIEEILKNNLGKKVLLHSCCAPCSSYVITYLTKFVNVTVLYYNPNIFPEEEYNKRKKEQIRFINSIKSEYIVDYMDCDYDNESFEKVIKGLENEPERGKRCAICFALRLNYTGKVAEQIGADYFATTLTLSPLKNAHLINEIGKNIKCKSQYLCTDFKKKEGYKRSIELSKEFELYRQNYCGCIFSKRNRK